MMAIAQKAPGTQVKKIGINKVKSFEGKLPVFPSPLCVSVCVCVLCYTFVIEKLCNTQQ